MNRRDAHGIRARHPRVRSAGLGLLGVGMACFTGEGEQMSVVTLRRGVGLSWRMRL